QANSQDVKFSEVVTMETITEITMTDIISETTTGERSNNLDNDINSHLQISNHDNRDENISDAETFDENSQEADDRSHADIRNAEIQIESDSTNRGIKRPRTSDA